ncbi:hypothetical protein E4U39_000987 [Claviceps sp. Clav50 group G5]|nr:hypothetical protein E4U39_000987 [Claviceps sp. Clav50 group G5]
MRICLFLSSYEGSGSVLEDLDTITSQPGLFTSQHEFEYRWIHKHKAEQQINDAVAEGFDFYINFLWGTPNDEVAGADASRYFESLDLPSCGVRCSERSQTKNDFYEAARLHGAPRVPGVERFPLFVKPGFGCASQLIDERSVCRNQEELESALRRMHEALYEPRMRRATALGMEDPAAYARSLEAAGRNSEDIVVQEYIEGKDYGCVVVQLGQSCVAVTPLAYRMKKPLPQKEQFLTFAGKFDDGTHMELLRKEDDAVLYEHLQQAAIEAFAVSSCRENNTGCDVDLRVTPDGQVFVIEVNPQPAEFLPAGQYQDLSIFHGFPGGHSALIDVYIANHLLRHPLEQESRHVGTASAYDGMAPSYDYLMSTGDNTIKQSVGELVEKYDFSGTILDLGCGTGVFGRMLAQSQKHTASVSTTPSSSPPNTSLAYTNGSNGTKDTKRNYRLLGCDISSGMLDVCRETGLYDSLHQATMHSALMNLTEPIDHLVCSSALQHIEPEMFSFVMVLFFLRASKSITLSVEDIPDVYNENLIKLGHIKAGHMAPSSNHVGAMEAFGVPEGLGWRLVSKKRVFSWASPKTGDRIHSTYFRFERSDDGGVGSYTMFRSLI